jgi:hypothetical protein
MQSLARRAMAVLASQGLFPAELVLDLSAMALSLPLGLETIAIIVDLVRCLKLPLVLLSVGPVAGLVLVRFLSRAAVFCLAV